MKNIFHSDYWVEIPAGDFLIGISPMQEKIITERMHKQFGSNYFPYWKKRLLENVSWLIFDQQSIHLERFYIMRYQISNAQVAAFYRGQINNIPGSLEGPEMIKSQQGNLEYEAHTISTVTSKFSEEFCNALGARLPSNLEWEKAARGTEGRLYPWGDEWDIDAGYFYRGRFSTSQEAWSMQRINAYPRGTSPYGIYGLVGYLPQLTGEFPYPGAKGCHPKETTAERAWIDNMIPFVHKRGEYSSLRPVLGKWPLQQWQGADFQQKK